jgi:hypothetical protein
MATLYFVEQTLAFLFGLSIGGRGSNRLRHIAAGCVNWYQQRS